MLASVFLSLAFALARVHAQTKATASIIAELVTAPDHVDRVADLPQDSEFVFDFLNPPASGVVQGAAGHLVLASVSDFPALAGNGIALLSGFLGPCGMNTPHTHPRATEFLYQVNGSIMSGMLTETGSRFIMNNVTAGKGMLLPQGSIHFQFNDNCEPVQFVSALNSEDPGTLLASQALFGLPPSIVAASLGEIGVEEIASLATMIPDDVAFGSQECLTRCGITVGVQPTAEQVPRVSGNALPSATGSAWAAAKATSTNVSRSLLDGALLAADVASSPQHASHSATIALGIVVAVLALGYVVLGALFLVRRRAENQKSFVRPDMRGRALVPTAEKFDVGAEPYDPVGASASLSRPVLGDA